MKKLFAFALSIGAVSAVFAQPNRQNNAPFQYGSSSHYEAPTQNNNHWEDKQNTAVYSHNDQPDNRFARPGNRFDDYRMNDWERHPEINRINQDYDRRVMEYRNDRRMNGRDRDYQIQELERERSNKLKSFGSGLLLGGLLGTIISH